MKRLDYPILKMGPVYILVSLIIMSLKLCILHYCSINIQILLSVKYQFDILSAKNLKNPTILFHPLLYCTINLHLSAQQALLATVLDRSKTQTDRVQINVNPLQMTQGIKVISRKMQDKRYDLHFWLHWSRILNWLKCWSVNLTCSPRGTVSEIVPTDSVFHLTRLH